MHKPPLKVAKLCHPKLSFKQTTERWSTPTVSAENPAAAHTEERLNGLALAYIHRGIKVKLDRVRQKWHESEHRKIHLAFCVAYSQKC